MLLLHSQFVLLKRNGRIILGFVFHANVRGETTGAEAKAEYVKSSVCFKESSIFIDPSTISQEVLISTILLGTSEIERLVRVRGTL